MRNYYLIILVLSSTQILLSQRHDFIWHTGFAFRNDTIDHNWGVTRLDFNTHSVNPSIIFYDSISQMEFAENSSIISDIGGDYLFAFNGIKLEGRNGNPVQNGLNLTNKSEPWFVFDRAYQASIILPMKDSSKYIVIHEDTEQIGASHQGVSLDYSIVNMTNPNSGRVTEKRNNILRDTLDYGTFCAIRHGNGQDWWLVVPDQNQKEFYIILIDQNGARVIQHTKNTFNSCIPFGGVTSNPSGDRIVYFSHYTESCELYEIGMYLHSYSFDRCLGQLTYETTVQIDTNKTWVSGAAFSPSGRLLYLSRQDCLLQIDSFPNNYRIDTVAQVDSFLEELNNVLTPSFFGVMQQGPDGRIYGTSGVTPHKFLFVINSPNTKGENCTVKQHSIEITAHLSLPSFPNYRLGPIDYSSCDSLSIDNIPLAEFRYNHDNSNVSLVKFTNLSSYNPNTYKWSFGDPQSGVRNYSILKSPSHRFSSSGIFEVCLEASNQFGTNQKCKYIEVGTTSSVTPYNIEITLYPNPFSKSISLDVVEGEFFHGTCMVNTILGELVLSHEMKNGGTLVLPTELLSGVYILTLVDQKNEIIYQEKITKF